jgi:uncharacterized protein YicC (UPF0701 family)
MQAKLNNLIQQHTEQLLKQTDDFRQKYHKRLHNLINEAIDQIQADLTRLSTSKGGNRENERS